MVSDRSGNAEVPANFFCFESYGVTVRIESDNHELLPSAKKAAKKALVGEFRLVEEVATPHVCRLAIDRDGTYVLFKNGEEIRHRKSKIPFFKYFDSMVRVMVAEYAVGRVFLHAGAVGWKGKAILIPADSFKGKTSLVAELVRNGAEYYSDDYAVLDGNGLVHPFARRLSVRSRPGPNKVIETRFQSAESLGGKTGTEPLPVGCILFTEFRENAKWNPRLLSPGQASLKLLSQTIPIRYAPEFSLNVLKKITSHAIIAKSPRGDAVNFAKIFLNFIDKKAL